MLSAARATKASSSGNIDFLKKMFGMCGKSTIFFIVLMVILFAIPISMLIMGAVYFDDCDAEDMIPIYLVVMGAVFVVRLVFTVYFRITGKEGWSNIDYFLSVVDVFIFAWFVAGCVFIYRTKDDFQSTSKALPEYCDYDFYWFSFWITTSLFILLGVVLLLLCLALCFAVCL